MQVTVVSDAVVTMTSSYATASVSPAPSFMSGNPVHSQRYPSSCHASWSIFQVCAACWVDAFLGALEVLWVVEHAETAPPKLKAATDTQHRIRSVFIRSISIEWAHLSDDRRGVG